VIRNRRRLFAWSSSAVAFALTVAHLILGFRAGTIGEEGGDTVYTIALVFLSVAFAGTGVIILSRQPRNPIGWLLIRIARIATLALFMGDYATYGLVTRPGVLPGARVAAWIDRWDIVPTLSLFIPLFLLFPDGAVPSSRWRPALWLGLAGPAITTLGFALTPGRMTGSFADLSQAHVVNPFGLSAAAGLVNAVTVGGGLDTILPAFLAGASLVFRFRSRRGDEREQVKWLAFVGAAFLSQFIFNGVLDTILGETRASDAVGNALFGVMFFTLVLGIPIACGVAILKYRLYDIDVVINKTVVYAALAAFITAVYVAIVVGIGALIGQGTSKPNLGLSIVATAVVAVAFQPVRQRVQRLANRLVYGQRATPYEVLSEFSSRMAHSYEPGDLLHRMARILAEGAGARTAAVWLKVGDQLKPVSAWPLDDLPPSALALPSAGLPELPGTLSLPVHHQGELLGALSLTKPPGERLTPAEEHLARDLASGAGLVLRNVRLTEELLARLEELRASRQRIVAASDSERRRLERNIHDGAQQQLVALAVKTRLARSLLAKDPARASAMLSDVEKEVAQAIEDIRDLARGIYPSLLAERGLEAALRAQARRAPFPVEVQAAGLRRHGPGLEAAVYFCCLEALQNVAKYAGASSATIRLAESDGRLVFEVEDDGSGFDTSKFSYGTGLQGMADRLAVLGGELEVRSSLGAGTTGTGRLPARTLEPVA